MTEDALEQRKEKAFSYIKSKKAILVYIAIILIALLGYYIRTANLPVLNGHLSDPDAHAFLRYARDVVNTGNLPELDTMRYYPLGFHPRSEFGILSHFIAYLYKFVHFFNNSTTLEYIDIIYPAIASIFGVLFFFLLIRRLFDYRIALLSTLCLTIIPGYLFRTMSGVSDKEALAMPLMFLSFYLFVTSWQIKKLGPSLIIAALAGIFTGLTALVWGGAVYILVGIGGFALFESLLLKFTKKDYYIYLLWSIFTFLMMATIGRERYTLAVLSSSLTTAVILFSLLFATINFLIVNNNLLKLKEKLSKINFPLSLKTFLITVFIVILITSLFFGPLFFFKVIFGNLGEIFTPQQNDRWSLTVAENHAVYINSWFSDFPVSYFAPLFVYLIIIGSIWLFFDMVKNIEKYKWKLTLAYTIFIIGFIFSKYSSDSILNGDSVISLLFLYGSIILMAGYLLYVYFNSYYKDKETFEQIMNMNKKYSLIFLWFIIGISGAKFLARLVFPFAPITCFLFGFLVFSLIDYIKDNDKIKSPVLKITGYAFVALFVFFIFYGFYQNTLGAAKSIGPIYNQEWITGEKWVTENTPGDAVFIHWWDYGYLVQTGWNRTTVTDGGNLIGPWNYFTARNVLTAQNLTEPLSFLKTHNVSYLLIVGDDIGKYPAYSSIGSDENYDRYSWIVSFALDQKQTVETRNSTVLTYVGGSALDEDFIYEGKLFPRQQAVIAGFLLPLQISGNTSEFMQPSVVIYYNGLPTQIPLECVFVNGKEKVFDKKGLSGCLRIIPSWDGSGQPNSIGGALYLSPRVRRTLFTRLYLYGEDSEIFKLGYSDENTGMPFLLYQGRLIAPMKIWKVNYPEGVKTDPQYLATTFVNPAVTYVKKGY
jgi:asparagine N-glycosylation enzyme membrane subunit Stt3